MSSRNLLSTIRKHCEPIIEKLGYELVDLEFIKESDGKYLRFYIWKPEGITIDDCQNVSEVIGDKLDEIDIIQESYYLEVSSPGLDRPLKTDKDLKRNLGKDIEVSLYKSIDKKKKIIGELVDYNDENITVKNEDSEIIEIDRKIISKITLAVKF